MASCRNCPPVLLLQGCELRRTQRDIEAGFRRHRLDDFGDLCVVGAVAEGELEFDAIDARLLQQRLGLGDVALAGREFLVVENGLASGKAGRPVGRYPVRRLR